MPHTATIIRLPVGRPRKKWEGTDSVFLHLRQITIGTVLVKFGRLDHGSRWRIIDIRTDSRPHRVAVARHLNNTVILNRLGSNETYQVSAHTLSYSAIWRLPQ